MLDVVLLGHIGQYDEAEALILKALEIRRTVLGPEHQSIGTTKDLLAKLRLTQGRSVEALELAEESLTLYHNIGIESAKLLLAAHIYRALALAELDNKEAQTDFAEAIEMGETVGNDAGRIWPLLLGAMPNSLIKLNNPAAPEAVARSLEVHRSTFGTSHPATRRMKALVHSIEQNSHEL